MRKKNKTQIIDAYENRLVLTIISGIVQIAGILLLIILVGGSNNPKGTLAFLACLIVALILIGFAIRCPICDCMKSQEYAEIGILSMKTGFFRCNTCDLSNKQIREYVDLLKRGVDIDKDAIARFNKRDF